MINFWGRKKGDTVTAKNKFAIKRRKKKLNKELVQKIGAALQEKVSYPVSPS